MERGMNFQAIAISNLSSILLFIFSPCCCIMVCSCICSESHWKSALCADGQSLLHLLVYLQ
jgi:hypothetical protein